MSSHYLLTKTFIIAVFVFFGFFQVEKVVIAQNITVQDNKVTINIPEPKLLPDSNWFWLKTSYETVRSWTIRDDYKKAEYAKERANKRLEEVEILISQGKGSKEDIEKNIKRFEKQIQKVQDFSEKAAKSGDNLGTLQTELETMSKTHADTFNNIQKITEGDISSQLGDIQDSTKEKFNTLIDFVGGKVKENEDAFNSINDDLNSLQNYIGDFTDQVEEEQRAEEAANANANTNTNVNTNSNTNSNTNQ